MVSGKARAASSPCSKSGEVWPDRRAMAEAIWAATSWASMLQATGDGEVAG
jgi:hypothetical protein